MKAGDIFVHKVSGQYAVVIAPSYKNTDGYECISVRMAKETKNDGTDYVRREFLIKELEPAQEHLTRELAEMELRRDMLDAAEERHAQKKLDKLPSPKIVGDIKIN